eukprot:CAMPEP_0206601688 /NCGR_PEP_ID=MMETSP0325_2-20121206/46812_1 /ASSEMBLY_ACC=CAM_ASM_000347 /TAXON_ID=2866 /ORGANISM="Crypthecodinium cohnii, Strain Seligo" /LENGTH=623 /DNA_ID=CAMNT_0054113775 /DNA_START=136 /DNA_END=2008 /DNA_ORIENTATION=-
MAGGWASSFAPCSSSGVPIPSSSSRDSGRRARILHFIFFFFFILFLLSLLFLWEWATVAVTAAALATVGTVRAATAAIATAFATTTTTEEVTNVIIWEERLLQLQNTTTGAAYFLTLTLTFLTPLSTTARSLLEAYKPREGVESALLYGNINEYAYYFTDLLVGSQSQRVSVIVDTGSSLCGFPCEGCEHCGHHLNPPFAVDKSTTASWIECSPSCGNQCMEGVCSYTQTYTEGSSISGVWFWDQVKLGEALQDNPPVNATMGCHLDERKLFYSQRVDGILGIAPHQKSGRPTVLQDLFRDRKHVNTGLFSLCLAEWGGLLSVGGHADPQIRQPGAAVVWLPLLHSGYYAVSPASLSLNGKLLTQGSSAFGASTLVDSGTTFVYFPTALFRELLSSLVSYCKEDEQCGARMEGDDCWRLKDFETEPRLFPSVSMAFENGAEVDWHGNQYLFRRSDPSLWCIAFADNGADASTTILGVSWLVHKDIIFDLSHDRLGVVPANCPENRRIPGVHSSHSDSDKLEAELDLARAPSFALVLVLGTGASMSVAVGVLIWVLCFGGANSCETKKRKSYISTEGDEAFLPGRGSSSSSSTTRGQSKGRGDSGGLRGGAGGGGGGGRAGSLV